MDRIWLKNYPAGMPATINIHQYHSVVEVFEQSVEQFRDRPSMANMGKILTYGEVDELASCFASYLQNQLKLKRGDRVAIMMPNLHQYPIAVFGALRAGCAIVNVNPLYTPRELEHQLKDSGAETIVILENFANTLQQVLSKTQVKNIIVTAIGDILDFPKRQLVNFVVRKVKKMVPPWKLPGHVRFSTVISQGRTTPFKPIALNHDDIAFLQYTGGTTGISKGAILTHKNIVANMLQAAEWIKPAVREGQEIIVTALPLYHIFSLTANLMIFTKIGALNLLITNPRDIPNFVKELKKYKVTAMTGVNTLFNALLNNAEFKQLDFSTWRLSLGGGMAVQRSVAEQWKKVTGVTLLEAYGLTETSPAACINPVTMTDYNGTIGLPVPSTEIEIRSPTGEPVPQGDQGELYIRGPQVMKGYWNRPEETEKVLGPDMFLATGDMAMITPEGYVKLVDRKKDMILVSGFNVYPNEIEDVISSLPGILEVACIGIPDEKSGEAVKVYVVKKDQAISEQDIISYAKKNLTAYKVPRYIEFRTELPKTNVGKILRRALRDQAANQSHPTS